MRRRTFIPAALVFSAKLFGAAAAVGTETVRGTLSSGPSVKTRDGRSVSLTGDDPTLLVLNDERLAGTDFEAVGSYSAPAQFTVNGIHLKSMFVYKNDKRLMVTYWCDICYIRTYSPGICVCCQKYTDLDLVDPDTVDKK